MDALGEAPRGDDDIFLKINDPKETGTNKRCIQFANRTTWNTTPVQTELVRPQAPDRLTSTKARISNWRLGYEKRI